MKKNISISRLPHTWLIDIDGTIFVHNSHKNGGDILLPGVKEFWDSIPSEDCIILLSARGEDERQLTLKVVEDSDLRYDHAIFGLPKGERILINDRKPKGLCTAVAIDIERDSGFHGLAIELHDK